MRRCKHKHLHTRESTDFLTYDSLVFYFHPVKSSSHSLHLNNLYVIQKESHLHCSHFISEHRLCSSYFLINFLWAAAEKKHIATQGLVIQQHPALTPASRFPSPLISWLYANFSLQCIKMNKSTSLRNCLERCYLKYEMPGSLEFHCLFQNTYFHVKQLQNIFWALTEEAPVWEEFLTISCALWCGPVGSVEAGRWSCQVKTVHWPLPPYATCKGYQEDKPQLVIQLILWLT